MSEMPPQPPDESSTFDQEENGKDEDFTITLPGHINGKLAFLTFDVRERVRQDNILSGRSISDEELDTNARQIYQDLQQSFEGGEPPPPWLMKLMEISNRRMGKRGIISRFAGRVANRF